MLEVAQSRVVHHLLGFFRIELRRRDFGILRMDRANMVVFSHSTKAGIAEFQAYLVVDRQLQRLADLGIGIRLRAVDLCLLVRANDDRGGGNRFGLGPAEAVHDLNEIADRFVKHVDFVGFDR